MSTPTPVVYQGTSNNGTSTLLTEQAVKAISAIGSLIQEGKLTWDEFWSVYDISTPRGIATFSDLLPEDRGQSGTIDDYAAICQEVIDAGGRVLRYELGNFVPHSNNNPDEPPSVSLEQFRHQIGLKQVEPV